MTPALRTVILLCTLSACDSPSFQTTSGQDYIASRSGIIDPDVSAAAAVEGELRFPARIGLVRLVNGNITMFPAAESDALMTLTEATAGFGEFVPLSPILGTMMTTDRNAGLLDRVQLISARQHMVYALVLSFDTSNSSVQAVFLDVRTGYPHATAQAVTDDSTIGWGAGSERINRRTLTLTEELLPQLADMLTGLAASSAN